MKALIVERTVDVPNSRTGRRYVVHVDSAYGDLTQPKTLDIVCASKSAAKRLADALNDKDILWIG